MLYNSFMEKKSRAKKIPTFIRQILAYNAVLDEAKPYELATNIGIFVVHKSITEIIEGTGSHYASVIRPGTFADFSDLVLDFSEGNLILNSGGASKSSYRLIFDLPVMEAANLAAVNSNLVIPQQALYRDLTRYKLSSDY